MEFWMFATEYVVIGVSLLIGANRVPRISRNWDALPVEAKVLAGVVVIAGWPIIVLSEMFADFLE